MHFTYKNFSADRDLEQGDILQRSPDLVRLIGQVHPYYLKDDYTNFIILTQSCDLVRRKGLTDSPYISIAAVRSLSTVVERESSRYQTNSVLRAARVVGQKSKDRLRMFLQRLLNNNHPEYFYLHEEPGVDLVDRSCAFLRLSIAVRSDQYAILQKSRVLSLEASFQSKLGWLVGNIFSRVGTDDWVPKYANDARWKSIIDQILDQEIVFVDDKKADWTRKNYDEAALAGRTVEEVRQLVQQAPNIRMKDDVIDAVLNDLGDNNILDAAQMDEAKNLLRNSPVLAALLRS